MNYIRSLKTLLVDDEPFVRDDLRYMLSCHREVDVVWETGIFDEAVKILTENCLDIVFLDIQLRGGNGFDLIPYINPAVTHLIIITAHEKYLAKASQTIARDCILKPVRAADLSRAIDKILY